MAEAFMEPKRVFPGEAGALSYEAATLVGAEDHLGPLEWRPELGQGQSLADIQLDTGINSFPTRLLDTFRTFGNELTEKGHRARRLGAFVVGGGAQAIDRFRGLVWILPPVFEEIVSHGYENDWNAWQTSTASGVAIGGIWSVWSYGVGRAFRGSMNQFPETTKKVAVNHPAMVGAVSDAVDGFPTQEELDKNHREDTGEGYDVGPYETKETLRGKAGLGMWRGVKTAFLYGSTGQVGMAKVNNHSDESNERRLRTIVAESAAVFGSIAVGLSVMISNGSAEKAEQIKEAITNRNYLFTASALLITWSAIGNHLARRKFQNSQTNVVEGEA